MIARALNAVRLFDEHVMIRIDCFGNVEEEPLSEKLNRELRRSVVQYVRFKEDNFDFFKVLGMRRTITNSDKEEEAF